MAAGGGYGTLSTVLGFIAVTCATINMVGGFLITDRMLRMFKKKQPRRPQVMTLTGILFATWSRRSASSCALQGLSSPKHARRGNLLGAFGMLVAVVGTLLSTTRSSPTSGSSPA